MNPHPHTATASSGTPARTSPPGKSRWPSGWLVAGVLALHLGLLVWWGQAHPGSGLTDMAEPEFTQALTLGGAPTHAPGSVPALAHSGDALPPPTVGQVVQARMLTPAPPPPPAQRAEPMPAQRPAHAQPKPQATRAKANLPPPNPPQPSPQQPATPPPPTEHPAATDPTTLAAANDPPDPTANATAPTDPTPPSGPPTPIHTENYEQKVPLALSGKEKSAINADKPPSAWLQAWPPSTRLNYTLKGHFRGDLYGTARVQWQRTGEQYQAQVLVNVGFFLDLRMTSQGRITPERLWPSTYQEERRNKKRLVRMGEQQVVLDNGTSLLRPAALQDTASQFVQLAQDFATGRQRLAVGEVVQVTLARPGGIDGWTYDVAALDTLPTALGPLSAYHLRPRPLDNPRGSVMADMWFAPSLRHQPVRIRLTLNPETWLELTLESATQTAEAPPDARP